MYILLTVVGLVASAAAKDLIVGHEGGRIIFEKNVTASPTIWQQVLNLTVNASDYEVITRVVVLDNREDKNGQAAVLEGGEGHENVTIELKSPAVFRGFDFLVQVYAKAKDGAQIPRNDDQQNTQEQNQHTDDKQTPKDITKGLDTQVLENKEITQDKIQHPVVEDKENQQARQNRDINEQKTEDKTLNPTSVAKDDGKKPEGEQQQTKAGNHTADDDLTNIFDEIFRNDSHVQTTEQVTTGLRVEDGFLLHNNNGPIQEFVPQEPTEESSTPKDSEKSDEQITQTQEVKGQQVKVPLPYINH